MILNLIILSLSVLLTNPSVAQGFGSNATKGADLQNLEPLKIKSVEIKGTGPELKPGQTVEVKLKLNLDPDFHAYLDQYKFVLLAPSNFYLSEFQVRPTIKFTDPLTKKIKVGTEGYAEMVSLLDIPSNINGGVHELKFALTYQACGKDFCLFPKTIQFQHKIEIAGAAQDRLRSALEKGWIYALFIVFVAGILTSLTPCIFPMIPITLAVLGTKDHGQSRRKGFILSSIYVLGIALTYALLGVAAAKTGALFGSLLGHPLVVGTIALLFVLMGLSMFGLFEIQVPQALTQKLSAQQSRKGYIGAFLSGLVAGVVASPCVGPVLISILAYVAQTQNVVTGFILLFVYALGLGQLFLLIGTFHSLWQRMPRSGVWMERVKFVFGSIMIGMAFYFIYPVAHSALFDGLLATAFFGLAFLTGFYKRHPGPLGTFEKLRRASGYLLVGLGVLFAMKSLIPAHMKEKLFPEASSSAGKSNVPGPEWYKYSEELLAKAKNEGRPVIVDFKAEWCLACKELELYTFSDANVLSAGKEFLWLEYDATSPSDELEALQRKYEIGGLPYVIFIDAKGEWRRDLTLTGFEKAPEFLERLSALKKPSGR